MARLDGLTSISVRAAAMMIILARWRIVSWFGGHAATAISEHLRDMASWNILIAHETVGHRPQCCRKIAGIGPDPL